MVLGTLADIQFFLAVLLSTCLLFLNVIRQSNCINKNFYMKSFFVTSFNLVAFQLHCLLVTSWEVE